MVLGIVFGSLLLASPAHAETKAEHDAAVAAAQAKVNAAQANLDNLNTTLTNLNQEKSGIDQQVSDAKLAVDQAQTDYNTKLINQTTTTSNEPGLKVDIYNQLTSSTPNMSTTDYTFCKTEIFSSINNDWGGGDIEGCGGDFIMLHYTGFLTVPETKQYQFLNIADDGWYFTLDNKLVTNDWFLKGCSGNWSEPITLEAGKAYPIDAWMYEWGGGACSTLYYSNNSNWGVVPSTWYSQNVSTSVIQVQDPALLDKLNSATEIYNNLISAQSQKAVTIEVQQQQIKSAEEELNVAQQELEAIPPFRELPPTPSSPQKPTPEPTKTIPEPLPQPEQTNPPEKPTNSIVQLAQVQLQERAKANDTGVLPYTLADAVTEVQAEQAIATITNPAAVASAISDGVVQTAQFVGQLFTDPTKTVTQVFKNVSQAGLDMTDDQREKAHEVIVPVVIVSQIASMMVGRIK